MGINKVVLIAALLATVPMTSFAEESFGNNQSIGVKASTLGLGLDYSFTIAESFEGRVGFNALNHNISKTANNVAYQGDIKLGTVDMLVDWFPANNSLRLTAGLMLNKNKLALSGLNKLNVTEYATADFRKASPYLGIGWTGKKKESGFSIAADLGVLFQGKPRTSVTAPGVNRAELDTNFANAWAIAYPGVPMTTTGSAELDKALAEDNQSLADALKNYKLYPVVSLTASYLF